MRPLDRGLRPFDKGSLVKGSHIRSLVKGVTWRERVRKRGREVEQKRERERERERPAGAGSRGGSRQRCSCKRTWRIPAHRSSVLRALGFVPLSVQNVEYLGVVLDFDGKRYC